MSGFVLQRTVVLRGGRGQSSCLLSKYYGNKHTIVDVKNVENRICVENAGFALNGVKFSVLVNSLLRWRKP